MNFRNNQKTPLHHQLIVFVFVLLFVQYSQCRTFKPLSAKELQSAIDASNAGDEIQLEAMDYIGDFEMHKSGNSYHPIKIIGTQFDDGSTSTQIVGNTTALYIKGDYWFIKDLNVTGQGEGLVIEGNRNHAESLSILEAQQAIVVIGDNNTLGSISISNVKDGILVQGNSNHFRDIAWSNASSGIIVESGDKNKLHNLAIHNNIKEGPTLVLAENTCCGVLTNLVLDGFVDIRGNKHYFRNTVGSEVVNILGCDNSFGRSVFGRVYFTKECNNTMRSSNVYHYPQNKPTELKDV